MLDYDEIAEKVAGEMAAGLFRRKKKGPPKSQEQIVEEQIALLQGAGEKASDEALKNVQEGVAAPWQKLRKQFPKK